MQRHSTNRSRASLVPFCLLLFCLPFYNMGCSTCKSKATHAETRQIKIRRPISTAGDASISSAVSELALPILARAKEFSTAVRDMFVKWPNQERRSARAMIKLHSSTDRGNERGLPAEFPLFPWIHDPIPPPREIVPMLYEPEESAARTTDQSDRVLSIFISPSTNNTYRVEVRDQDTKKLCEDTFTKLTPASGGQTNNATQQTRAQPSQASNDSWGLGMDEPAMEAMIDFIAACVIANELKRDIERPKMQHAYGILPFEQGTSTMIALIQALERYHAFIEAQDRHSDQAWETLMKANKLLEAITKAGQSLFAEYLLIHVSTTAHSYRPSFLHDHMKVDQLIDTTFKTPPFNEALWTQGLALEHHRSTDAVTQWTALLWNTMLWNSILWSKGLLQIQDAETHIQTRLASIERTQKHYTAAIHGHTKALESAQDPLTRANIELEIGVDFIVLAQFAEESRARIPHVKNLLTEITIFHENYRNQVSTLDSESAPPQEYPKFINDSMNASSNQRQGQICNFTEPSSCHKVREDLVAYFDMAEKHFRKRMLEHMERAAVYLHGALEERCLTYARLVSRRRILEPCSAIRSEPEDAGPDGRSDGDPEEDAGPDDRSDTTIDGGTTTVAQEIFGIQRDLIAALGRIHSTRCLLSRTSVELPGQDKPGQDKSLTELIARFGTESLFLQTIQAAEAQCRLDALMPGGKLQRPPFIEWAWSPPDADQAAKEELDLREAKLHTTPATVLLRYAVIWPAMAKYAEWVHVIRTRKSRKPSASGGVTKERLQRYWNDYLGDNVLETLEIIDRAWTHYRKAIAADTSPDQERERAQQERERARKSPFANETLADVISHEDLQKMYNNAKKQYDIWVDDILTSQGYSKKQKHRKTWNNVLRTEAVLMSHATERMKRIVITFANEIARSVPKAMIFDEGAGLVTVLILGLIRIESHLDAFSEISRHETHRNAIYRDAIYRDEIHRHFWRNSLEYSNIYANATGPSDKPLDSRLLIASVPSDQQRTEVARMIDSVNYLRNVFNKAMIEKLIAVDLEVTHFLALQSLLQDGFPLKSRGLEDPFEELGNDGLWFYRRTDKGLKKIRSLGMAQKEQRATGILSRASSIPACRKVDSKECTRQFALFVAMNRELYRSESESSIDVMRSQLYTDAFSSWIDAPLAPQSLLMSIQWMMEADDEIAADLRELYRSEYIIGYLIGVVGYLTGLFPEARRLLEGMPEKIQKLRPVEKLYDAIIQEEESREQVPDDDGNQTDEDGSQTDEEKRHVSQRKS